MVTLLGFLFIIGNVMLIEIFMPDLIGPVSHVLLLVYRLVLTVTDCRVLLGCIIVSLSECGCKAPTSLPLKMCF
jgi:hypothetical protein